MNFEIRRVDIPKKEKERAKVRSLGSVPLVDCGGDGEAQPQECK